MSTSLHLHPQGAQISRRFDLGRRVIQVLRTFGLVTVTAERAAVLASHTSETASSSRQPGEIARAIAPIAPEASWIA
ncbi:MAG TPA: hypothetical protein VIJ34_00150 [Acidimicrobiales bacterium]